MNTFVSKIVVLNTYCHDGRPFAADLDEPGCPFARTIVEARQRVLALGHEHDQDNFYIEWFPHAPGMLTAIEDGCESSTKFEVELKLEGKLAQTMLTEYTKLAVNRMKDDIRRENEAKIQEQAEQRIQERMLNVAEVMANLQS